MNPFDRPLQALFRRLNQLNGATHLLAWLVADYEAVFHREVSAERLPSLHFGRSLVLSDLTDWPEDRWRRNFASGAFAVTGEQFIEQANLMVCSTAAMGVAQGFEAHEVFLYELVAITAAGCQDAAAIARRASNKLASDLQSVDEWRAALKRYVRGRNNDKLLALVRKLAPFVCEAENANNRRLDLGSWYRALAIARHAITHSEGILSPNGFQRLAPAERQVLSSLFGVSPSFGEVRIEVKPDTAEEALKFLVEHGFVIYKSFSQTRGFEWRALVGGPVSADQRTEGQAGQKE